MPVETVRLVAPGPIVDNNLGFLADLAGTWTGQGFNLIARPDRQGGSPLFLELNQTFETLKFIPIGSAIPNRGSADTDIEMWGLTYQQMVTDLVTGGGLHIEEGMWVHVPSQDTPPPPQPATTQSVFRLGTIPHGNALLAQGSAINLDPFNGNPFDPNAVAPTNTVPFKVGDPWPIPGGIDKNFFPYDLSNTSPAAVNFRTPFGDNPPIPLPTSILGVPLQQVIQDPTLLLKAALAGQTITKMVVITVASQASILQVAPNPQAPPVDLVAGKGTGGGVENIPFIQKNADAATVFAIFWLESIKDPSGKPDSLQLQYVQTVLLNFPVIQNGQVVGPNLSWPHVSVATLRQTFGGQ